MGKHLHSRGIRIMSSLALAQDRYDNTHEEDFNPPTAVERFIESTEGSNWLYGQAVDLVAGRDSDFVTQAQFRQYISERLTDLEWDDDQDDAQVDLLIYAYTDQRGGKSLVKRLFGVDGLEGLANDLLGIAGAAELHLSV
jgi:hypothetical protein